MKNKKTSKILILLMIVTLLIPAFGGVAYAESDGYNSIAPMTVGGYVISFIEGNSVRGDADVYVTTVGIASSITSKITLQSANLGSASYSNVSGVAPSSLTVYNKAFIKHLCSFPITSGKNYRIKIEITDVVNGKKSTFTKYQKLSRS